MGPLKKLNAKSENFPNNLSWPCQGLRLRVTQGKGRVARVGESARARLTRAHLITN